MDKRTARNEKIYSARVPFLSSDAFVLTFSFFGYYRRLIKRDNKPMLSQSPYLYAAKTSISPKMVPNIAPARTSDG